MSPPVYKEGLVVDAGIDGLWALYEGLVQVAGCSLTGLVEVQQVGRAIQLSIGFILLLAPRPAVVVVVKQR